MGFTVQNTTSNVCTLTGLDYYCLGQAGDSLKGLFVHAAVMVLCTAQQSPKQDVTLNTKSDFQM